MKMLSSTPMAAMRKLNCNVEATGEGQEWAVFTALGGYANGSFVPHFSRWRTADLSLFRRCETIRIGAKWIFFATAFVDDQIDLTRQPFPKTA